MLELLLCSSEKIQPPPPHTQRATEIQGGGGPKGGNFQGGTGWLFQLFFWGSL